VDLRRTYLKLDTQGFDLEVLRGGAQVISTLPALQTEVSFHPFYEGMPDYKMAIAAFETYGPYAPRTAAQQSPPTSKCAPVHRA
jgi:Methyltransferase FkbM domain